MSQFRTGTGWFAPVVPPEAPLTKEQVEAKNAERIRVIRESGDRQPKRPSFIKRMSSGVEMLGFSSSDAKNGAPSKNARGRGQSLSEGVAQDF